MKYSSTLILSFIILVSLCNAQNGKELFEKNCKACHSIGSGKIVGPDLAGISQRRSQEWFVKFTKDSKSFIESGDKEAKAIFDEYSGMPMSSFDFPEQDIIAIYTYISEQKTTAASTVETVVAVLALKGNFDKGKDLFTGKQSFENGGPSCMACHVAGALHGGTIAKDITNSGAMVSSIMGSLPFPAMKDSYFERNLNEQEIADITEFLTQTSKENPPKHVCVMYPAGGVGGFLLFLLIIGMIWRKRKKNAVNKEIYDRQIN